MLSSWVCKTCGTINDDFIDKLDRIVSIPELEEIVMKRQEYENRGEIPKMFCSMCREERIQGRVR